VVIFSIPLPLERIASRNKRNTSFLALEIGSRRCHRVHPRVQAAGDGTAGLSRKWWMVGTRRLYRPHPQGREARGPAGGAVGKIRVGHHQPDRANARNHRSADPTRHCRRGDRAVGRRLCLLSATRLPKPTLELYPQPAEADMEVLREDDAFDSTATLAARL
jgi:hypothetical protein